MDCTAGVRHPSNRYGLQPWPDRVTGEVCDLELHGMAGLSLGYDGPGSNAFAMQIVGDLDRNQIAAPKLAVDRKIEERQITSSPFKLEPDTDGPDILALQWCSLANMPSVIRSRAFWEGIDLKPGRRPSFKRRRLRFPQLQAGAAVSP
jgi:hypothetical protein